HLLASLLTFLIQSFSVVIAFILLTKRSNSTALSQLIIAHYRRGRKTIILMRIPYFSNLNGMKHFLKLALATVIKSGRNSIITILCCGTISTEHTLISRAHWFQQTSKKHNN